MAITPILSSYDTPPIWMTGEGAEIAFRAPDFLDTSTSGNYNG